MLGSIYISAQQKWDYPPTPAIPVYDTIWSQVIQDNYRWMEDMKNPQLLDWMKNQAEFTNSVTAKIPGQELIISELKALEKMRGTVYGGFLKAGNGFVYRKYAPGEEVIKIYYRPSLYGPEKILFDPATYIPGKVVIVSSVDVNEAGNYLLMTISEKGAEFGTVKIMEIPSGKFLKDEIPFTFGYFLSGANDLVLYTKNKGTDIHNNEFKLNSKAMLHKIGTPVTEDKELLSAEKNPELKFLPREIPSIESFENSPYVYAAKGTVNRNEEIYVAARNELISGKITWRKFCERADQVQQLLGRGNDAYFLTAKGAPMYVIKRTSFLNPDVANAQLIYQPPKEWKISRMTDTRDFIIIQITKNELETKNLIYNINSGSIEEVKVPYDGLVRIIPVSKRDNECFITVTSWTTPFNIYQYNLTTRKLTKGPFHMELKYKDLEYLVSEEVEIPSHDGTLVPLSIIYDKRFLKNDGRNICYLSGYGAYGMSRSPSFPESMMPLVQRGVIVAIAHVRGGGEKGEDWYKAGYKTTKPNTWKDFNACAEWLIEHKYTSADKLSCAGGSAGGILIGRAITERPDLYRVAIPMVGCLNQLRGEFSPNGPVNIPEFGTVKDSIEFKALYEMDAMHHVKPGTKYPAQYITTGFNDPRVISWIPAKYAATVQAANRSDRPQLLYVDYESGHGGSATRSEAYERIAKLYAFLLWQCEHPKFQPKE